MIISQFDLAQVETAATAAPLLLQIGEGGYAFVYLARPLAAAAGGHAYSTSAAQPVAVKKVGAQQSSVKLKKGLCIE